MARETLRPRERIRGDARFGEIRSQGVAAGDSLVFLRALENGLEWSRFGLAVSRKAGGSVVRSRLRRVLREAFRLNRRRLPAGLDLLLSPRKGTAEASLQDLGRSLTDLAEQACRKLRLRRGAGRE